MQQLLLRRLASSIVGAIGSAIGSDTYQKIKEKRMSKNTCMLCDGPRYGKIILCESHLIEYSKEHDEGVTIKDWVNQKHGIVPPQPVGKRVLKWTMRPIKKIGQSVKDAWNECDESNKELQK